MTIEKIDIFKIYRGDINGFFGLFLNNLTNLIVLTGLLFSIGMPSEIVMGRIIPGISLAIFSSSLLYFIFSYRLAKKEGREDVTSLPTGLSVPHMFLIVYVVILPVLQQTGNAITAWHAAIAWTLFEGTVEVLGAFAGPYIRKIIPRASLLGSLAGVSLIFIALRPMFVSMQFPFIAFVSFTFIMLGWMGKGGYFGKIPVGLIVIVLGIATGILSKQVDFAQLSETAKVTVYIPKIMDSEFLRNLSNSWQYIATALPLGIYNFLETMDNLESASASGDNYNTKTIMLSDGFTSILGCVFGSGFPTALYIGHPGWKKMGGRRMYTLMSGSAVLIVGCFGVMEMFTLLIPEAAMLPILAFIGLSIAEQAVNESPRNHMMAIFIAIFPWIAEWAVMIINSTVGATVAALNSTEQLNFIDVINNLEKSSISYSGLKALGSGAILISIIWSSLVVFITDGELKKAIKTTIIAAALSYFGIIHGERLGIKVAPDQGLAYLAMGMVILIVFIANKNKLKIRKGEMENEDVRD